MSVQVLAYDMLVHKKHGSICVNLQAVDKPNGPIGLLIAAYFCFSELVLTMENTSELGSVRNIVLLDQLKPTTPG